METEGQLESERKARPAAGRIDLLHDFGSFSTMKRKPVTAIKWLKSEIFTLYHVCGSETFWYHTKAFRFNTGDKVYQKNILI